MTNPTDNSSNSSDAVTDQGRQVKLEGLSFPVTISWLDLKRAGK